MSSRRERSKKHWKAVFNLFLVYLLIIPTIYFILDSKMLIADFKDDPFIFLLKMISISFGISFIINTWSRKDPAMRQR